MFLKVRNKELYFVLLSIFFSSQIFAEEVSTQETKLRDTLTPLGSNVVGKSLPDIVINEPYRYIAGRSGKYIYQMILNGEKSTDTRYEKRGGFDSKVDDIRKWSLKIDNDFIEEWQADSKGNIWFGSYGSLILRFEPQENGSGLLKGYSWTFLRDLFLNFLLLINLLHH